MSTVIDRPIPSSLATHPDIVAHRAELQATQAALAAAQTARARLMTDRSHTHDAEPRAAMLDVDLERATADVQRLEVSVAALEVDGRGIRATAEAEMRADVRREALTLLTRMHESLRDFEAANATLDQLRARKVAELPVVPIMIVRHWLPKFCAELQRLGFADQRDR